MNGADHIETAIRAATAEGRPAIAAFVTAGYPTRDEFPRILESVASAADVVEVGVPFSDPMADGVTIQRSSQRALEQGVTLGWILDQLDALDVPAPIVLMSYLNPLLAFGLGQLATRGAGAGVRGIIVPDVPFEECERLRHPFDDAGIAWIQLVTPVTPAERRREETDRFVGFCRGLLEEAGERGELRPDIDSGAVARGLYSAYIGRLVQAVGDGDFDLEAMLSDLEAFIDNLLTGIAMPSD